MMAATHSSDCTSVTARKRKIGAYLMEYDTRTSFVSEVDPMSVMFPLRFRRRIERQWAERFRSLRRIRGQIVVATELALQRAFDDRALIPIPVRAVADRRRRNHVD